MLETLYPFQMEDVKYLATKTNVADFSEMGTGKTYKAIGIDSIRRRSFGNGATLVVAPLSVLTVWETHFEELTGLKVRIVDPKPNKRHELLREPADVYGVHWEGLRLLPELRNVTWLHIIADEVHKAKNRKAKQTKALGRLSAGFRTGLTGTPITNKPDDLWSILNWLYPREKEFRSYWRFLKKYVVAHQAGDITCEICPPMRPAKYYITHGPRHENLPELQNWIKPFTIRRLKKDVLPDLPDKYYTRVEVGLNAKQRRVYNDMRDEMLAWVGENESEPLIAPIAIAKLIRLQQIALGTPSFDHTPRYDQHGIQKPPRVILEEPSTKIDALMDILDQTDRKVVVFTTSAQAARLTAGRLDAANISAGLITGDQSTSDRRDLVQRFQAYSDPRVVVGTIRAGGEGITLTAADTVVFLDRDWSPSNNSQAEDRLHRIGQSNAVQVIDITAKETVDQGKDQKLTLKREWIRSTLGDK